MKKVISVFLAALMFVSCFAVTSFAVDITGECDCENHNPKGYCSCCLFCDNIDLGMVTSCAKESVKAGADVKVVCCHKCTGIYPCNCGCACCDEGSEDIENNKGTLDEIVTEESKKTFVETFQAILKQISDAFDEFFNAIFEFLKIDGVIGKGEELPEDIQ